MTPSQQNNVRVLPDARGGQPPQLVDSFLDLPARAAKPRQVGLTSVIDRGLTVADVDGMAESIGHAIDLVKLGWGTAVVTQNLEAKLERYRAHRLPVVLGGTLTELAIKQGRVDRLADWLTDLGIHCIEVSDGIIEIDHDDKLALIERLSKRFSVLSEVGTKDASRVLAPATWVSQMRSELDAGAWKVIAEARETGTSGIFGADGMPLVELVSTITDNVPIDRVLFEAPMRKQQVWFLQQYGNDVNFANIAPCNVMSLETLRLGLRAETADVLP